MTLNNATMLEIAVQHGDVDGVQRALPLIRHQDLNRRIIAGGMVKTLLLEAVDQRGEHRHTFKDQKKYETMFLISELLIMAGADATVDMPNTGNNVWHRAATFHDDRLIKMFVKHGAQGMNAVNQKGQTPLKVSAQHAQHQQQSVPLAALHLIQSGADVNVIDAQGSVLHDAMLAHSRDGKRYHTQVSVLAWAKALTTAGLDIGLLNDKGQTVMHWIAERARLDVAQHLWRLPGMNGQTLMNHVDHAGKTPWQRLTSKNQSLWHRTWSDHERYLLQRTLPDVELVATPIVRRRL